MGGKRGVSDDATIVADLQYELFSVVDTLPPTTHLAVTASPSFRRSFTSPSGVVVASAVDVSPFPRTYTPPPTRSEEHTSELQSHVNLVCRLLLEKKKKKK